MRAVLSEPPTGFLQSLSALNTATTLCAVKDGSGKSMCGYRSICVLFYMQILLLLLNKFVSFFCLHSCIDIHYTGLILHASFYHFLVTCM